MTTRHMACLLLTHIHFNNYQSYFFKNARTVFYEVEKLEFLEQI